MPWSLAALAELAKLFTFKKAVAVDLDNTLWKGVIGEDGVEGIEPDTAFQRRLKTLKERGVVLVALSKNDPEDVEPVWNDPRMTLKKDDFTALEINWNEKADNLRRIAAELNIGTDAFVFIDDRPSERAAMRTRLPEVTVAPWPADPAWYFPGGTVTDEDARKTSLYREAAERRNAAKGLSLDDYLAGLEIVNDIHVLAETEIPRVTQLSQKTNQFNVRTNRFSEDDLRAFAADPRNLVVTASTRDRFGDLGLVAFVRVRDGEILDWVMSCRAMNRRLELEIEREVERMLSERGIRRLTASWRRSGKNAPVEELFEKFGFRLVEASEGLRRYEKPLDVI